MNNIVTSLLLVIFTSACVKENENCHIRLHVINNSNIELFATKSYEYPDSLSRFGEGDDSDIIQPMSTNDYVLWSRTCYETVIPDRASGVMMVFLFDNKLLRSTPTDTVRKYKVYLRKYDLTVEDLQRMNWTITYP